MEISAQQVKELRDQTGAGFMDCKRALQDTSGDTEKARMILREKGLAKALKKATRETSEGVIATYVHGDGRIGVMLELACETDFVARNEEFRKLARDLAMQVAAMNPLVVKPEDLPEATLKAERELYLKECADKPQQVRDRIVEGKLEKFYEQACLIRQPYIREETQRVEDVIKSAIAKLGENVEVKRFVRMALGETPAE